MSDQSPTPKEQILKLLAEYRYLTVKQLWDKTGAGWAGKSITQTRVELNRLKKAGLVTNHTVETNKGGAAEKHWMLLRPGAQLAGVQNFDNRYKRPPSPSQAEERKLEIHLEDMVSLAIPDWKLLKPRTYNSAHPLPGRTEQFYLLCQAVSWNYYQASGKMPDDLTGPHTLGVPRNSNHYIAYRSGPEPGSRYAVVFLLPPYHAGLRYWQDRIKQYKSISEERGYGRIRIYALFKSSQEASSYQRLFVKTGIEPLDLGKLPGF